MTTFDRYGWSALARWYQTPAGARCAEAELGLLRAVLPALYGVVLAACVPTVGAAAPAPAAAVPATATAGLTDRLNASLGASPVSRRWLLGTSACAELAAVAEPYRLPFPADSVDVLILYHLAESLDDPRPLLAEARRVLNPNGHLLLMGFNLFTPAGLARWGAETWKRLLQGHGSPPLVAASLRGWLLEQHFETLSATRRRFAAARPLGWGGSYLLVAQKKVIPPTLIRPRWQPLPMTRIGSSLGIEGKASASAQRG